MLKNRQIPHICRKKHNALSQRVFKTAPLFAVTNPTATATPTVLAAFTTFFESLWSPVTGTVAAAQKSGMSYVYDEDGTLIAQTLAGGASTTWGQSAKYVHLPTASGPMPVAAIYGTKHYAVQSDHLNTPRRLIQSDGQVAWQWAYSAFGDEQPTVASNRFANTSLNQSFGTTTVPAVTFNLRYPGQYFDQESNLHYNYHRSYSATTGRYTQSDPIGLDGGWNRFGYVGQNPLSFTDPDGFQTTALPIPTGWPISIPNPITVGLGLTLALSGDTSKTSECDCYPVTQANINLVLTNTFMRTYQPFVSATAISGYISIIKAGVPLQPINVDDKSAIVDGNHRYIATLLCHKTPIVRPWPGPLTKPSIPLSSIVLQP
jgi:RHS repeat-associated protein